MHDREESGGHVGRGHSSESPRDDMTYLFGRDNGQCRLGRNGDVRFSVFLPLDRSS